MTKNRLKQFGKWLSRQVAWLLILTIVANVISAFVAPKVAKAVDASDNMYLFWDGDCTSPPSGWSTVSDAAGEEFYDTAGCGGGGCGGLFPRGGTSYSRLAGGALNHTHADAGSSSTAATAADRKTAAGNTHNATAHTHTVTLDSVSSVSSLPGYENLCVIKNSSGIPNGNSAIPSGAIAIFDAAVPGANWSDISSNFASGNEFVRGNSSAGGTGGSNTHQATGHTVAATLNGTAGTIAKSGTTATRSSLAMHTHTASGTSDTPDTQPQYITIILGKATANTAIPNGMIAMFNDTDSSVGFSVAGWTRLSDSGGPFYQRFLKVTGAYGTQNGANQHSHAAIGATSTASASDVGGSGAGTIPGHQHPVTINLADGTNTNNPPYTDIVIAKKQTVTTTFTTDQADYGQGETVAVSTTVTNYGGAALNDKYIDAVIFEDTVTADGKPTVGEKWITNGCAGWDADWAANDYTHQNNNVDAAAAGGTATDNWNCSNANFPDITTYTLWMRWYDSASYAYDIYYEKSVTFTSVPTLTEILFMMLVGCAVFLGVRTGAIKFRMKSKDDDNPSSDLPPEPNHHGEEPQRSNDGITYIRDKTQNK